MFKPKELGILAQGFDTLAMDDNGCRMLEQWFSYAQDLVADSGYSDAEEVRQEDGSIGYKNSENGWAKHPELVGALVQSQATIFLALTLEKLRLESNWGDSR